MGIVNARNAPLPVAASLRLLTSTFGKGLSRREDPIERVPLSRQQLAVNVRLECAVSDAAYRWRPRTAR